MLWICLKAVQASAFQQGLISVFCQPASAFEVAFESLMGTLRFLLRVYPQDITGHLMVILAFASGVQEREIGCEMTPVVVRYVIGRWRFIIN
jgi:hypothetical protein